MIKKHKRRVPVVKQVCQTECGLACCVMLLNYYKSNESIVDLQNDLDVGRDGISLLEMRNYLRGKGFDAKVFRLQGDIERLKGINQPFIAYWKKSHFIVVEKIAKQELWVNDPALGHTKMSYEEFYEGYSGYILLAEPTTGFKRQKHKTDHPWAYIFSKIQSKIVLIVIILVTLLVTYGISVYVTEVIQSIIDEIMVNPSVDEMSKYIVINYLNLHS